MNYLCVFLQQVDTDEPVFTMTEHLFSHWASTVSSHTACKSVRLCSPPMHSSVIRSQIAVILLPWQMKLHTHITTQHTQFKDFKTQSRFHEVTLPLKVHFSKTSPCCLFAPFIYKVTIFLTYIVTNECREIIEIKVSAIIIMSASPKHCSPFYFWKSWNKPASMSCLRTLWKTLCEH